MSIPETADALLKGYAAVQAEAAEALDALTAGLAALRTTNKALRLALVRSRAELRLARECLATTTHEKEA